MIVGDFYSACTPSLMPLVETFMKHHPFHMFHQSYCWTVSETFFYHLFIYIFCSIPANIYINYVKLFFVPCVNHQSRFIVSVDSLLSNFILDQLIAPIDILVLLKLLLIFVSYEIAKPIAESESNSWCRISTLN